MRQGALCALYNIGHYPTLKFGRPADFEVGKKGNLEDYSGARAEKEIIEWIGKLQSTCAAFPMLTQGSTVSCCESLHTLHCPYTGCSNEREGNQRVAKSECTSLHLCRAYDYDPNKEAQAFQQAAPVAQKEENTPKLPQRVSLPLSRSPLLMC